nr:MAK10-like protein [Tanacetum cinerariifolium]
MKDPEQAFIDYASSRTDEAGGKWYTFKLEQNNLGDTYNPSWKSHPNLRWRQPQNSPNNFSNPSNRFQPNDSIPNHSLNNRPQNFNNQTNIKGLVSEFMASQDARLSKFEADFKQQAIWLRPRNWGLIQFRLLVLTPQCSTQIHSSINAITIHPKQQSDSRDDRTEENEEEESDSPKSHFDSSTPPDPSISFLTEKVRKFNSFFESLGLVPPSPNAELVCTKEEDGDVMFIEIIPKDDDSYKEEPEAEGPEVEYFDIFPTRSELAYHKRKLDPRKNTNGGFSNFTRRIKGMHVFVGNFTYMVDFMIVEYISSIIDPRLSHVVLEKPFIEVSNVTHDLPKGIVRFTNENDEVAYKIPP